MMHRKSAEFLTDSVFRFLLSSWSTPAKGSWAAGESSALDGPSLPEHKGQKIMLKTEKKWGDS